MLTASVSIACVQEIDAYWLQRRIAKAFGDAIDASKSQELAEQVRLKCAGT